MLLAQRQAMKTLISRLLVVPGEAEINNANSHGEIKYLQLLLSQISVFKVIIILKWKKFKLQMWL